MTYRNRHNALSPHAGFTLVEIMVGLVIGMLASLVIMQVFSVFETQKRTTTGTADAQTNGSIALYNISRELQMSGWSLMPMVNSALECTSLTIDGAAGFNHSTLSPVSITDGISDSITIRYGDAPSGGSPDTITAVGAPTPNDVTLGSNIGCAVDNRTLIVNGTACTMANVTAVTGTSTVTLSHPAGAAAGANLACLGSWRVVTYALNAGNLERNGIPSVSGIVNLQAQYGISDTPSTNQITAWVDAAGGTWANPTLVNRNRIKAVRIAVVARNAKMEPTNVTTACSSTVAATPTGLCTWAGSVASPAPTIDLSADANWQRYRYRVFETVIPIRNMIWAKETL